ncbi:type II secretion system F family protein [Paenibacillus alkaliterrae]|uniref:type II secretion system F family protein n=1 Tax=Paenibacillus alkaliterrae TaxID=320909 RepID=UPI001F30C953|nr:type II secretion system F family protein [Paenibacillus alkaliterrae]MCF2940767.1 type II secretion system F family protein [Paenibacillus alkaliterrae]
MSSLGGVHRPRRLKNGRMQEMLEWCGWENEAMMADIRAGRLLTNYDQYHLSRRQFVITAAAAALIIFAAVYLFYHSVAVSYAASVLCIIAPRFRRRALRDRRKERLKLQFKEALFSLTSSLAAGRSLENAFLSALDDLRLLYPDPRTELLLEFQIVRFRLDNAEPLEYALRNLADRAHIDEITHFVDALAACKRSGGDLLEVMKRTSIIIGEKLETEQEIAVMMAQKKFEGRIMMAVPFVFLAFLGFAAPDYMAPLYGGTGYFLLTAALLLLLLCFWIMGKMMSIRM